MPIAQNAIERLIFRFNLAPEVMLDFLAAQAFRLFVTAHRLGVFEALAGGSVTAEQVARRIKADERGTTLLLQGLEAVGYVGQKNGGYAATAMTAKWLPILSDGLGFFEMLLARSEHLEESIRRGGPAIDPREWLDQRPHGWRDFQAGMIVLARMAADQIAARVRLPKTARRLLDVGGGHGLYSITLCRRYPQLSATVFDLPQALEAARETIAAENMARRVEVRAGDFWKDDLGDRYDVALLFNIIHGNLPAKNTELLRRVASALNPGGLVVILDQLTGKVFGTTARAFAALMGLNLFNLAGGQTYGFEEIAGWFKAVGFTNPRHIRLLKSPGNSLVLGTKAASARNLIPPSGDSLRRGQAGLRVAGR